MKEKEKKKSKTKVTILVVSVFIAGAFVISLIGQSTQKKVPTNTQQYILNTGNSVLSISSSSTSSSSKATLSHPQLVQQFIQNYLTQTLDASKLTDRESQLKFECSDSVFQSLAVDSTTQQLQFILADYQKTKQMNTNSSVRLVNRVIQSVSLYQKTDDSSQFYADVVYKESAPDNSGDFSFEKRLMVKVSNQQITEVQEISTNPVSQGGTS